MLSDKMQSCLTGDHSLNPSTPDFTFAEDGPVLYNIDNTVRLQEPQL